MARRKKIKINKKNLPIVIIAMVLVVILAVLDKSGITDKLLPSFAIPQNTTANGQLLSARFIDVGQGDCTLFVSGEETMLIDCGEAEYAKNVIRDLKSFGVTELDYVVTTHAHSDHMGGMAEIIDVIPTENIILSEPSEDSLGTKYYGNFLDVADNCGAEIILAEPDYTFSFGNAECKILAPSEVSKEENNNSVVMYITAGTTSFLMSGDAEKAVEKEIIKKYPYLRATILKVGHHGSKTSSYDKFISMLNCETAVVSVGDDNNYGHPTQEVLQTLKEHNINYYRTDIVGTITIDCYADSYTISTER